MIRNDPPEIHLSSKQSCEPKHPLSVTQYVEPGGVDVGGVGEGGVGEGGVGEGGVGMGDAVSFANDDR